VPVADRHGPSLHRGALNAGTRPNGGPRNGPGELSAGDYRRVLAVLEAVEPARSQLEFRAATLGALDEHFGYRESVFILGGAPAPGNLAHDGVLHGFPHRHLDEYLERWASKDAAASPAAQVQLRNTGSAALEDYYDLLEPERRHYVEAFLLRVGIGTEITTWLNTSRAEHGFLTLFALKGREFGDVDRARLFALQPHLQQLLAHLLPPAGAPPRDSRLSQREHEVASLVAKGLHNRQIAVMLQIGEDTVKKHVSRALAKLDLRTRTELALAWGSTHQLSRDT